MFTLASASGNVFAFAWENEQGEPFDGPAIAGRICPRGAGLGLDGVFLLGPPKIGEAWVIEHWDSDGSRSFCSNGTRTAAALLPDEFQGLIEACSSGEAVLLDRRGLDVGLRLSEGEAFKLMDPPANLPYPAIYAWTGTPQLILQVGDVDSIDLSAFAPPLRFHPELPFGANVSVLQVISPGAAKIRTWERGVEGETLSCGQGAAAAVAWLAEQSGIKAWEIQPRGIDKLSLTVGGLCRRRWSELWLRGPVRVLGEIALGPSLADAENG
jgi:diaminopimelate epimerase